MQFRARLLCLGLCALLAVSGVAAQWEACPAAIAGTCRTNNNNTPRCFRKALPDGTDGPIQCRNCADGYMRNDAGSCVPCNVTGCASCSSNNVCERCKGNKMLGDDGTCGADCPAGCQSCSRTKCWPCGRTMSPHSFNTLGEVAAKCGASTSDLIAANAGLRGFKQLQAADTLGQYEQISLPPASATPQIQNSSLCPNGTYWLTCSGSKNCPTTQDDAGLTTLRRKGTLTSYGCVQEATCTALYNDCLEEADSSCPNCCVSRVCRDPVVATSPMEQWYIITFAQTGGSGACDPPGWGGWWPWW